MSIAARAGVALFAIAAAQPALAQRTDDNATEQAQDAFGTSVGDDSIGIYNPFSVRGFSPVDAGNVRLEGLYFDQQADFTSRIVGGSTVRVGISAQSYPFPAPTGIADYDLRKPGRNRVISLGASYGPYNGALAEVDVRLPIDGDRLGFAGGVGLYRSGTSFGGSPEDFSIGGLLRWAPRRGIEVIPFWSRIRSTDSEAQPLIFTAGAFLPPRLERGRFFGQSWADNALEQVNYGIIARADPLGFDVALGVFRSISTADESAADLLFGTDQAGRVAQRIVVVSRDDRSASTSGELRIARQFDEGPRRHRFIASVRGRAQDRRYGGAAVANLGVSTSIGPDPRTRPPLTFGAKTLDRVRQTTFGLAYKGRWRGIGELSLGIQRTDYSKAVTDPDPLVIFPVTRDRPWLPSATAAVNLSRRIALYAGYTEGLEESPVAPSEAVNLNEAPPAIRTRQMDAGVRVGFGRMTAVTGVFQVEKPYFNIDGAGRFRRLGEVRHRGIELSLTGRVVEGLNLVAGTLLYDAVITGEEVASGTIGPRPVASFRRYTVISADYRMPFVSGLSVDAVLESTSDRVANAANTLFIPARSVVSLGTRYRFRIDDTRMLIRAQIGNIANTFGLSNCSSGLFVPNGARRFSIGLAADL